MKSDFITLAIGFGTGGAVEFLRLPDGFGWVNVFIGFTAMYTAYKLIKRKRKKDEQFFKEQPTEA